MNLVNRQSKNEALRKWEAAIAPKEQKKIVSAVGLFIQGFAHTLPETTQSLSNQWKITKSTAFEDPMCFSKVKIWDIGVNGVEATARLPLSADVSSSALHDVISMLTHSLDGYRGDLSFTSDVSSVLDLIFFLLCIKSDFSKRCWVYK